MTKRILTIALGVAVIAVLVAPTCFASNMGFKLERQLTNIASSRNLYIVSLPYFRSYEDLGSYTGPGAPGPPDGVVTAVDVLMDWFTNGDGSCDGGFECDGEITLQNFVADPAINQEQLPTDLTIKFDIILNGPSLIGTDYDVGHDTSPGRADEKPRGYVAIVAAGDFPTITVGSHDPDFGNGTWSIPEYAGSRNLHFYSLPYHTTFTTASELLTAMYDTAEDAEEITLQTFDPDPTSNDQQIFTDCTARPAFPPNGAPDFSACTDFPLVPGQGYNVIVAVGGPDGMVNVPLSHY